MRTLGFLLFVVIATCPGCDCPNATPSATCDVDCLDALDPNLLARAIEVNVVPPDGANAIVRGTALLVLRDSRGGAEVPIADVRPRLAALAPGIDASTFSGGLDRTDDRGMLAVKFTTACFPFSILVQLPNGRSTLAEVTVPEANHWLKCGQDAGLPSDAGLDGSTDAAADGD